MLSLNRNFCTFAFDMNRVKRIIVWLGRLFNSRGFGIQSPTDYSFVRYVINEHWPYYAYQQLDELTDDWLTRKMGRLYFRLANWRQPFMIQKDEYEPYWKAGCRRVLLVDNPDKVELARIDIHDRNLLTTIFNKVDSLSVVVIESIYQNWELWREIEHDHRTGTTYDLYYCGIVFFDLERHKKNYKVNF